MRAYDTAAEAYRSPSTGEEAHRKAFDPDLGAERDPASGSSVLQLDSNIDGVGDPWTVDRVAMGVNLEPGDLPAYGQVLAGDQTLSVRGDQAVQTWRIVEPVLQAWRDQAVPLQEYKSGSDGPTPLSI